MTSFHLRKKEISNLQTYAFHTIFLSKETFLPPFSIIDDFYDKIVAFIHIINLLYDKPCVDKHIIEGRYVLYRQRRHTRRKLLNQN